MGLKTAKDDFRRRSKNKQALMKKIDMKIKIILQDRENRIFEIAGKVSALQWGTTATITKSNPYKSKLIICKFCIRQMFLSKTLLPALCIILLLGRISRDIKSRWDENNIVPR